MNDLQKLGGVAAIIMAATFLFGIAVLVTTVAPLATGELDPVQTVSFLADHQTILYVWNAVIYLVFGAFLVVLAIALYERLKAGSPVLAPIAAAYGLIWAGLVFAAGMVANVGTAVVVDLFGRNPDQAATVWQAISGVQDGLGGGNEIVGGLWVLLLSWAALRGGGLPRALSYFGVVVGAAGVLSAIPAVAEIGQAVFGLGAIVWFVWLGVVMLRGGSSTTEEQLVA